MVLGREGIGARNDLLLPHLRQWWLVLASKRACFPASTSTGLETFVQKHLRRPYTCRRVEFPSLDHQRYNGIWDVKEDQTWPHTDTKHPSVGLRGERVFLGFRGIVDTEGIGSVFSVALGG